MRSVVGTRSDARRVDALLGRLSIEHDSSDMRGEQVQIPGTEIDLWTSWKLRLNRGVYRVTWRYEERDGRRVIVCFTLSQV
jgi:hypothetical protein